MSNSNTFGLVVAGVGGQGAITIAQLALGAAWMSGLHVLQSEIHGMSQRGGEVSAHILMSKDEVTSPTIELGTGDLLLGIEPLEALRHLEYLKKDAKIITSTVPMINMETYPDVEKVTNLLSEIDGTTLVDTEAIAKELKFKQAGNIALLGAASNFLPIKEEIWEKAISERFEAKGEKIIEKNMKAFYAGKKLLENA